MADMEFLTRANGWVKIVSWYGGAIDHSIYRKVDKPHKVVSVLFHHGWWTVTYADASQSFTVDARERGAALKGIAKKVSSMALV